MTDCRTAFESINLYIDGQLSEREAEKLSEHICVCETCRKHYEGLMSVKKALNSIKDIEPPKGLAQSAITAAKKRRVPVYAYASACIAAAITLIAVFSSGILTRQFSTPENGIDFLAEQPAAQRMESASGADSAPVEGSIFSVQAVAPECKDAAEDEAAPVCTVYVPGAVYERFSQWAEQYSITSDTDTGGSGVVTIQITQDDLQSIAALVEELSLSYEGDIQAGTFKFILEN